MNATRIAQKVSIFLAFALLAGTSQSDESKFEVGFRANVLLGDGVPSNDILGLGVISRYRLSDG